MAEEPNYTSRTSDSHAVAHNPLSSSAVPFGTNQHSKPFLLSVIGQIETAENVFSPSG